MFGNKRWPAAVLAAGLIALGCGKEQDTVSKSAEHEHGAPPQGHESHAGHEMPEAAPTGASAGHQHGARHEAHDGHPAPAKGSAVDHSAMGHGAEGHAAPADSQPTAAGHDHSGHSQPAAPAPAPEPEAPSPGQPAKTLSPDALDSPAATSVQDAQRAEAMAQGGSHAGHGGTYTHVDAGRSESQAPVAVYSCPMHPEVNSSGPGTCPKCGMALVERREE